MFELYKHADVCYVYLTDVSDGADARNENSEFWRSRWHFRGWTLQELIAPKEVVFLDKNWKFFGTKYGLATTLYRVTGIDFAILTGMAPLDSVSVARRMSWAATRETTRVEDEAYSLLGIFGVHLSPIYGEGRNAFLRLQEEIIKTIPDQTIFVWGTNSLAMRSETFDIQIEPAVHGSSDNFGHGLLAPSPRPFRDTGNTTMLTPTEFASRMTGFELLNRKPPSLHYVITPEGARINFLTVPQKSIPQTFAELTRDHSGIGCKLAGSIESLALLPCEAQPHESLVALILFRPSEESEQTRGLFVTSTRTRHTSLCFLPKTAACRFVYLSPSALRALSRYLVIAETVILRSSTTLVPTPTESPARVQRVNLWARPDQPDDPPLTQFRLNPRSEERLRAIGFGISPLEHHRSHERDEIVLTSSLTIPDTSAESQSLPHIPFLHIRLSIIRTAFILVPTLKVDDTVTLFYVTKVHNDNHQTLKGAAGVGMSLMAYPCIVDHDELDTGTEDEKMHHGRFQSEKLEVTAHKREIAGTKFFIDVGEISDENDPSGTYPHCHHIRTPIRLRRILRLSLECPQPENFLESVSRRPPEDSLVPCLLLSVELSDVYISMPVIESSTQSHGEQGRAYFTGDCEHCYADVFTQSHASTALQPSAEPLGSVAPHATTSSIGSSADTSVQRRSATRGSPSKRFLDRFGLQKLFRRTGARRHNV